MKVRNVTGGVLLSISSLAKEFGTSRETLRKRITEAGVHPADETGPHPRYRLRDIIDAWTQLEDRDPDSLPPFERRAFYQGEIDKLTLETKAGALVPHDEVERDYGLAFSAVSQHLDTIVDVLERDAGATSAQLAVVEQVLDRLRDQLFERLTRPDASPAPVRKRR